MARKDYADQVRLLVRILPLVAEEKVFALKGGTAINLFFRNLPRLSVDIDLTYLPIKDRNASLADIKDAIGRIRDRIEGMRDLNATMTQRSGGAPRIIASKGRTRIKIETSPVTRGVVFDPVLRRVSEAVEDEFGFAEMKLVSFEDVYGGKLHAALDRQHPRDLFDVKYLYANEGITDDLFRAFMVYVASSPRPAHELLNPNRISLDEVYAKEFVGMDNKDTKLSELLEVREKLIDDIQSRLDGSVSEFLMTLQAGKPNFDLIDLPDAAELPAIQWKVRNLRRLIESNPDKHVKQLKQLTDLFH